LRKFYIQHRKRLILNREEQKEEDMPTQLTPAEMKQFVRDHFEDFVNQRNASVIRKNMAPDFYDHDGPGGKPTGVDGDEQMMLAMYKAMPDLHLTIGDMVAEGDKVVCRKIWRWTDTASGKKMQFHGFVLWRFEGDKIAERWATVTPPLEGTPWAGAQAQESSAKRAS
jgi:predicted ester cyclase